MFSANIGSNVFSCTDGAACDLNPATGIITTGTNVHQWLWHYHISGVCTNSRYRRQQLVRYHLFEIDNTGSAIALRSPSAERTSLAR